MMVVVGISLAWVVVVGGVESCCSSGSQGKQGQKDDGIAVVVTMIDGQWSTMVHIRPSLWSQ